METGNVERPSPRCWPQPLTEDEYVAFTPYKLELVAGYLIDGPDSPEGRLDLLAALLKNCGLEAAAALGSKDVWREAMDHVFTDFCGGREPDAPERIGGMTFDNLMTDLDEDRADRA